MKTQNRVTKRLNMNVVVQVLLKIFLWEILVYKKL